MLVAMGAVAVTARRMIAPNAFLLALVLLACAGSTKGMWQPLRIDHHGWQLALLAWAAASLTDPKPARAGATLGVATALSLSIGMEMLLYLAAAGAVVVLMWVRDAGQARRLFAYGVTLAGGCAFGFLVFASEANRAPVCDALSPVWLSAMVAAGAAAVMLAWASPATPLERLAAAGAGGRGGRRRLRLDLAELPRPARAGAARARPALAVAGPRGDADLAARHRCRHPDPEPAGRRG